MLLCFSEAVISGKKSCGHHRCTPLGRPKTWHVPDWVARKNGTRSGRGLRAALAQFCGPIVTAHNDRCCGDCTTVVVRPGGHRGAIRPAGHRCLPSIKRLAAAALFVGVEHCETSLFVKDEKIPVDRALSGDHPWIGAKVVELPRYGGWPCVLEPRDQRSLLLASQTRPQRAIHKEMPNRGVHAHEYSRPRRQAAQSSAVAGHADAAQFGLLGGEADADVVELLIGEVDAAVTGAAPGAVAIKESRATNCSGRERLGLGRLPRR